MSKNTYGSKIREMREKRAWSQEQLAEVSGVGERTVQRAERGEPIGFESLRAIANGFGIDVKEFTEAAPATTDKTERVFFYNRLNSGTELFGIVGSSHAYRFGQEELKDTEIEEIAEFSQELHDWAEIWDETEPGEKVRVIHSYTEKIRHLENIGLRVFGLRTRSKVSFNGSDAELIVANVFVARASNPTIIKSADREALPVKFGP